MRNIAPPLRRPPLSLAARPASIILAVGLIATATLAAERAARAQDQTVRNKGVIASPPMPPIRPAGLPAPPPPAAAQVSAPPPSPVPPGVDPMVADFAPDMPQILPPASRVQMHKCGSEWQKMKESGAAAEKTWLAFAQVCLTH